MEKKIRIEDIQTPAGAATETLWKTVADEDGNVDLPINVNEVLEKMGIESEMMPLEADTSGLLVKDKPNEPFKAVSNMHDHPHRARFTFAHELGHFIHSYQDLPEDKIAGKVEKRDELSSRGCDPDEIWANQFAAALLMPASIVRYYWAKALSPESMAAKFGVSLSAMNNRLSNLDLFQ